MNTLRNNLILIIIMLIGSVATNAQLKEIDFIKGGVNDAQVLFKEYLTPYANGFGANLNGGWYNTAKPHKLGGFDVTVTVNAAWAPVAAQSMDLAAIGLDESTMIINGADGSVAPTIAGKQVENRPMLSYSKEFMGNQLTLAEYEVPNGTGINLVPLPMAQASIGLPLGTEITGRFLPSINLGNAGSIGLWGVGVKHSIFQHIPVLKRIPVLEGSVQGGYTKLNSFANVNFYPEDYEPFAVNMVTNILPFKGQKVILGVEAYTINAIFSQTLPVVTFYQGIGYSSSKTRVALEGMFPFARIDDNASSPNYGQLIVDDTDECMISDPLDAEIENSKDLRLNAGIRFKLGVLTIHFDYTKANYSVVTGGIGISFR